MWNNVIEVVRLLLDLCGFLIVLVGGAWGLMKYLRERGEDRLVREQDLAWRKTEFLFELEKDFESDEHHVAVWRLLTYGAGLPKDSSLTKILSKETKKLTEAELKLRVSIDNYLDFFDTLSHFVYVAKSMRIADLEVFGWYIAQIGTSDELSTYARSAGFDDVLRLSDDFRNMFGKKPWYTVFDSERVVE